MPASRTQDGEQLYVSLFTPTSKSPYWDGHLRSYRLDGAGHILDSNGNCAVDSVDCCSRGFKAVGKTAEGALKLYRDVKALEAAGETVFAIGSIAAGARGCTVFGSEEAWSARASWSATHEV